MEIPSFAALLLDRETKASERPGDHKDELRLWLRLLTCSTLIETEIRNRLREEFRTTLPRFDLMAQLDKSVVGMTVGEVSQRLMVSNGNVTAVVAGLVAEGLVDKRPAPQDRRVQILTLTAQGRKSFKAMAERHESWIAELFAGLDQPERAQLFRLLGETKASLHRAIAGRLQGGADEAAKGDAR
ncbi:MarR family winged helix-turn-helix transcriptional regulator [Bosea minatitlanensis]|uniref:MarR family winged helix-turn-helix transcriptional regulator n=1 Tax=Bosea minatitlanensis TaxID=128782 RepID=A0ABW0FBX2_9HYPH|nr:MarR family transcriptional regulator [Bosea minatitlanensis]MCT4495510.1 MarR family transcriptional regulator [Bosea minatitlanensis]